MAYNGQPKNSGDFTHWDGELLSSKSANVFDPLADFPSYGKIYFSQTSTDFGYVSSTGLAPFINARTGGTVTTGGGVLNRYSTVRLSTQANASGSTCLSSFANLVFGSGMSYQFTVDMIHNVSSSAAQRYTSLFGFWDPATAILNNGLDGVFFTYSDNINSGNWRCVAMSNGVSSVLDTSVAAFTSSYQTLEVYVNNSATTASFYQNGTLLGYLTSSIPSGTARATGVMAFISKSTGTTAASLDIDTMGVATFRTTPV